MRWGYINGAVSVAFVESANPDDLESRLVALLAQIAAIVEAQAIAAVELGGAGDGDVFTARVEYGALADFLAISTLVPTVLPTVTPVVYMADNATELAVARTRAYTPPPAGDLIGSEMAGATQAHRVCVLEILGTLVPPPPPPP